MQNKRKLARIKHLNTEIHLIFKATQWSDPHTVVTKKLIMNIEENLVWPCIAWVVLHNFRGMRMQIMGEIYIKRCNLNKSPTLRSNTVW